jgi:hypothetical protein
VDNAPELVRQLEASLHAIEALTAVVKRDARDVALAERQGVLGASRARATVNGAGAGPPGVTTAAAAAAPVR